MAPRSRRKPLAEGQALDGRSGLRIATFSCARLNLLGLALSTREASVETPSREAARRELRETLSRRCSMFVGKNATPAPRREAGAWPGPVLTRSVFSMIYLNVHVHGTAEITREE